MPRRTKASLQALTAPLLALLLAPCGADVDLTGLWTGSPSGSPKEILLAQRDPDAAADSASFELVCRTTDYMTSSPCGWTSARCTVAGDAVTCTLPVGSGTANAAGDQIMFSGGPDNKFTGGLSGIWASASDKGVDAYLMLHNATTNAVVVWWDTGVTPNTGPWAWGAGVYTPPVLGSPRRPLCSCERWPLRLGEEAFSDHSATAASATTPAVQGRSRVQPQRRVS